MKSRKPKQTSSALPRTPCSPSYYTFRNRDGQAIQLRGDLTMEDLVRMGYSDLQLFPHGDIPPLHYIPGTSLFSRS